MLFNCEEEPLSLNPDAILPEDDILGVTDTLLPVDIFTISAEALETQSIGVSPLGVVNDTVFGILETEFLTDFIYSEEVAFKDESDFDSVDILDLTLELIYSNSYGNFEELDFDIHELTEPLPEYPKSDYTMHQHMFSPVSVLESIHFLAETVDEVGTSRINYDTCVVTLTDAFAQKFLDPELQDNSVYESYNQRRFKEYFNGFYFNVSPRETEGGGIIQVDHSLSRMILETRYWNEDLDEPGWDTVSNIFSLGNPKSDIDSGGVHLNLYRNIASDNMASVLDDTIDLSGRTYIQALSGPRSYLKLPALEQFREEIGHSISVNYAQLIIPFDSVIYNRDKEKYPPPRNLGIIDSRTNEQIIDDTWAENYLGGFLDTVHYEYRMNMGNHVHLFMQDEENTYGTTFYLFPSKGSPVEIIEFTPSRILINGSTSADPPKLRIVYSVIPD